MRAVLLALVRLVAPVVPHTAEEVWDHIERKDEEAPSVHLAHWPEPPAEWHDAELLERWRKVALVRSDVLREIEKLRAARELGGSLEASVRLGAEGELLDFLRRFEGLWPAIFIASTVEVCEGAVEGAAGEDCPGLTVSVSKSEHPKCVRCWNHLPTVGSDADHPELCARCAEVVRSAE